RVPQEIETRAGLLLISVPAQSVNPNPEQVLFDASHLSPQCCLTGKCYRNSLPLLRHLTAMKRCHFGLCLSTSGESERRTVDRRQLSFPFVASVGNVTVPAMPLAPTCI